MKDRIKVKGKVTVRVLDRDGKVKRRGLGWLGRLLGIPGRLMEYSHHNIVTSQGDALIADALTVSPQKTKVKDLYGTIQVGTGWTGNSTKSNTRCNTTVGPMVQIDGGYPMLKAEWGNLGDNTVLYRATFTAGKLNANGINEACLLNGSLDSSACLAYAQITPSVNVTSNDTLQILWEITIVGQ